jgi:hypothetical protein
MDISSLADGLTYCGEVFAVRQKYFVFEASDYFMVLSFSASKPGAGNFNVVDKKAVQYVHARFERQRKVTANAVVDRAHRSKHVPDSLAALNILYVLAATGAATVETVGQHQQLFFRVLKLND